MRLRVFLNHKIVLHTAYHELGLRNSDLESPQLGLGEHFAAQTMSFSDYELTLQISDRISDHRMRCHGLVSISRT